MTVAVKREGKLIVISAPSGCGKTTIVARLLERNQDLKRSISFTTRPPRPSEVNGRDYFFVTVDDFKAKERAGFFLESAQVFGQSYGTSKDSVKNIISEGVNVVLAIDVQGMRQLKVKNAEHLPVVSIFIMPPSLEDLKVRLEKRKTETKEQMEERLRIAKQEMKEKDFYDFVVVNHAVDQAVKEIEEIIK